MNSAMSGASLGPSLISSPSGKGRSLSSEITAEGLKATDFNEIFSTEMIPAEGIEGLAQQLSADQLAALKALLANGNQLPDSAEFADGTLLGNPALMQLLSQLTSETDGSDSLPLNGASQSLGAKLNLADLKAMLLQQQAGGAKGEALMAEQGGKPINPAALLFAKGEIPLELQALKPAMLASDISSLVSQGNSTGTAAPFSSLLSGLEQLSSQRTSSMTPAPITVPTGQKGWDNVLGNRIMWMVGKQMQQASIQITPRHLGPIDIQVSVHNEQTSVSFVAQNGIAKEALEAAIPRLRELFADSNLQLVNVDVGHREAGSEQRSASRFGEGGDNNNTAGQAGGLAGSGEEGGDSESLQVESGIGLVDDYA
ncbi:MAG: flagellar hook-length control protein FliK [Sedimenticola sp.]|nr:flagellar hook-length control protein FliK [Sedimenticola sp.]